MHIKDFCKENLSRQQVKVLKKLYGDAMYAYRRIITPEFRLKRECKIVCVKSNCADLFYAPYWGKQLKGWISNGKT